MPDSLHPFDMLTPRRDKPEQVAERILDELRSPSNVSPAPRATEVHRYEELTEVIADLDIQDPWTTDPVIVWEFPKS